MVAAGFGAGALATAVVTGATAFEAVGCGAGTLGVGAAATGAVAWGTAAVGVGAC